MFFFFDGDENVFDNIKHVNEYGQEFWYARELQPVLEYSQWRYLKEAIERAKTACNNSGQNVADHFAEVRKMVDIGSNAKRSVEDYELSRYACYLIVMNGDPRKEIIATETAPNWTDFELKNKLKHFHDYIPAYAFARECKKDIAKQIIFGLARGLK